ncbi:LysR family transcriptional regulator [Rhodobacterales bacterium 52_120_T64]|nr:LysR family transcriptional regulator [Rhodobacterales bacterium 52_120_T64]
MSYINNIKMFVRVVELGSLSAAGRDLRASPAVASNRIKELEKHLGVRLFNRTTRKLTTTEHGRIFYSGALKTLEALNEAEAAIAEVSHNPKGSIHVTAPLGFGRRLIAPLVPIFHAEYPEIEVRLRLSDRMVDITTEALDVAFKLGQIPDSNFRIRGIIDCKSVLAAAPSYLEARGTPKNPNDLLSDEHACLLLRFPGSTQYNWELQTPSGIRKIAVYGPFESDDGDVLTDWALGGHGIINKPWFEIAHHLAKGDLVEVLPDTPPSATNLAIIYPHKRLQDPKVRLFIDFMTEHIRQRITDVMEA